jgi:hypothetical protein
MLYLSHVLPKSASTKVMFYQSPFYQSPDLKEWILPKSGMPERVILPNFVLPKSAPPRFLIVNTDTAILFRVPAPKCLSERTWRPLPLSSSGGRNGPPPTRRLGIVQVAAEVAFACQPMAHLAAIRWCGHSSWKPWLISAACDITR